MSDPDELTAQQATPPLLVNAWLLLGAAWDLPLRDGADETDLRRAVLLACSPTRRHAELLAGSPEYVRGAFEASVTERLRRPLGRS